MAQSLKNQALQATKWSAITEIMAKLVMPISNMVLARLLTPEAFGVVATLTMIISFAELFTDAGFQKYLVQHEFTDETDREQSTTVAFWSNFIFSMFIWIGIAIFSKEIATLVGGPDLGLVLTVSCVSIPLAAFSSIQMALFKRDFDFKTLFKVRIVGVAVPLVVTIPLAIWLRSYWALVFGTIAKNLADAVLLTAYSKWKPRLYYSISKFKEMFSFTIWSLFEAVSIWLTGYVDIFIVGYYMSKYYLGLYTTSSITVAQIMGLIQSTTVPVLFSTLSRLQHDDEEFQRVFYKFSKIISIFLVPIGAGIFCFSHLVTAFLLGEQLYEAEGFIGLWGLMSTITILWAQFSSEVYRAKGKPKLSVLVQWLHIIVLWPVVLITVHYGFETLYIARSLVRGELIIANMAIMYAFLKFSPIKMVTNIMPSLIASVCMIVVAKLMLGINDSIFWQIICVFLSCIVYLIIILMFKEEHKIIKDYTVMAYNKYVKDRINNK
jgi:PST family polysaccharide transporter